MLESEASCREFLTTQDAATVARQIKLDHQASKEGKRPSPLVWYLPKSGALADNIIRELYPQTKNYSWAIKRVQYSGVLQGIKAGLHQWRPPKAEKPEIPDILKENVEPSGQDYTTAIIVLQSVAKNSGINGSSTLDQVIEYLKQKVKQSPLSEDHPHPESAEASSPDTKSKYVSFSHVLAHSFLENYL
jgi:hypothetical protein